MSRFAFCFLLFLCGCSRSGNVETKPPPDAAPHAIHNNNPTDPAERRFAEKLISFLMYCEGTARLLADNQSDTIAKRSEKATDLYADIPGEIQGKAWAKDARAAAKKLLVSIEVTVEILKLNQHVCDLASDKEELDKGMKALSESCRKNAASITEEANQARAVIPAVFMD